MKLVAKSLFYLIIFAIMFIFITFLWGFTLGKTQIHEKNINIHSKKIPKSFSGSKIVSFSDINLNNSNNNIQLLENTVNKINDSKAQFVVFQGGLVDPDVIDSYHINQKQIVNQLIRINSKYGKFAILSDAEKNSKRSKTLIKQILTQSGFIILNNSKRNVYINGSSDKINFINYSSSNIKSLKIKKNLFNIAFDNNPENLVHLRNQPIDYFIYGYTLNNLVQPQFLQDIFKKDIKKVKKIIPKKKYNKTKLINNPGIGTRILNFRIWNNPKIVILNLSKE